MGPMQPYSPTPYPIWGLWNPRSPISTPHNLYGGYEPHAVLYPHPIAYMSPIQPYSPTPYPI